jgi:hypothetical protein
MYFFLVSTTMVCRMLRELLAPRPARDPVRELVRQDDRKRRGVL